MPIFWRYLLCSYLRVFTLSVCSFVAVLFVLRFKDIARFAALSADGVKTGLFILYQFPAILPIALPISALIASFLLFQRLSQTHELTALRALGLSLGSLLAPLLLMSYCLTLLNFAICAELAPYCRRETKNLLYRKTGVNPLVLLQRQQLARLKNTHLQLKTKQNGEIGENFLCITYNERNKRLNLISIKHLSRQKDLLLGKHAAFLFHMPTEELEAFDSTILENQQVMSLSSSLLAQALKKKRLHNEPSMLSLKQLSFTPTSTESLQKKERLANLEILRRYSLSAAVCSFTLLGCAFGIHTGRHLKHTSLFYMCGWTLFMLISYFLGKSLKTFPIAATLALLLPHPILGLASFIRLRKINRGK